MGAALLGLVVQGGQLKIKLLWLRVGISSDKTTQATFGDKLVFNLE